MEVFFEISVKLIVGVEIMGTAKIFQGEEGR
jgi:hypothetical protein